MTDSEQWENFIKEQDFCKTDTPDAIKRSFEAIMNDGIVSGEAALNIITDIISAIRSDKEQL